MTVFRFLLFTICITASVSAQPADTLRLTLEEALRMAMERAPEPRLLEAVVAQADAALPRSFAPPPLEVSLEYGYVPRGEALSKFGERTIALDQTIPSPLSMHYRSRETRARRDRVEAEMRDALREFRNRVTMAYHRVSAVYKRMLIAEEQHRNAEFVAHAAETRASSGAAAKSEVIAARAMLATAEIDLERLRTMLTKERLTFMMLLGRANAGDEGVYLPSDSLSLPGRIPTDEGILGAMLARSPRLDAARSAVRTAQAISSLAVSELFPSVSVGVMDQKIAGLESTYGVRLGLAVPLWFALDQRSEMNVSEARVAEAEARLEMEELAVRAWALAALAEFHARRLEYVRYSRDLLPQANELLRLTERGWAEGETSFLEVIQARRHHSMVADDALTALLSCLEVWTEIQSLLSQEDA